MKNIVVLKDVILKFNLDDYFEGFTKAAKDNNEQLEENFDMAESFAKKIGTKYAKNKALKSGIISANKVASIRLLRKR